MPTRKLRKVIIVSNASLQASLLKDLLDKSIELSVEVIPFKNIYDLNDQELGTSLFVFDHEYIDQKDTNLYLQLLYEKELHSFQALINMPKETPVEEFLLWPNLVGVFYDCDNFETLIKGLNNILLKGEFWFSRSLSQELITAYRKNDCPTIRMDVTLTEREKQIMQLLSNGASNSQIADALFVSENTVKTHLHNIFKKIKVKNRLQALMWLRNTSFTSSQAVSNG